MFNAPCGFNAGPSSYVPPLAGSTIREAVYSLLASVPAVVALADGRVSPGSRPQGEPLPAVTYLIASRWGGRHWGGTTGIKETRVQVSAWSLQEAEAEALGVAIHDRLIDYHGRVGEVQIEDCGLANEVDLPERPADGADDHIYRVSLDFIITYRV